MCEIDSIVCVHPKKQKEVSKIHSLFSNSSQQSHNKKSNSNPKPLSSNKPNKFFNKENKAINNKPNLSYEKPEKIIINKILNESDIQKKSKTNIKILSEKDLITEDEEPTTPLMNLQKTKKPNYLMKSEYMKNKSLTPQDKLYQNNLCPIYDFYKMETELNANTSKHKRNEQENNMKNTTSFTQYINKYNQLSHKENDQINTIQELNTEKLTPMNDEENNFEYNKNFFEKNLGENTPASLGETFSPLYDLFDENIFNHDKSPMNYKQMNVNININNNQQNNNIYYHFPYIINNVNSGNTNNNYYFNNNNNNNDLNDFDKKEYLNEVNNNDINNNIQMNDKLNINDYNNRNLNSMYNIRQNIYPKNNIQYEQMNNNYDNNNNYQINFQNNINENEEEMAQNNNINYINNNMNSNSQMDMIKLIKLKQNLDNYLNNYSSLNNNNINYNMKLNNNNYINNNYAENNQNIYNNGNNKNNLNNNLNYLQMISNYNNNTRNMNYNQFQNYNKDKLVFNNSNNIQFQNQNQQIYNNNYYQFQNNLMNNMNLNNNYNNNNYIQNNINFEQILSKMSPYELAERCHLFSQYQNGCRYLQDFVAGCSKDKNLMKAFFEKVLEHIQELSKGQFSHYFVKKILIFLNEYQILKLIKTLSPVIEDISTNQYGTKVIQDLIDLIKTEKAFFLLLNILTPYIKQLIIDLNGMQIVYKLITKYKNVKIIENIICTNIVEIANSKKGSNFLIKYFEFAEEENSLNIKKYILMNLKDIITDQFGNYVIQCILMNKNSEIVKNFVDEIKNNIIFYSNNKFSSNAVEKCFENENIKNDFIKLFMIKEIFEKIILDKFGNYVAQKAIATADDNEKIILIDLLRLLIPELKNKYFGEKLLSKMEFLYPNFFNKYN